MDLFPPHPLSSAPDQSLLPAPRGTCVPWPGQAALCTSMLIQVSPHFTTWDQACGKTPRLAPQVPTWCHSLSSVPCHPHHCGQWQAAEAISFLNVVFKMNFLTCAFEVRFSFYETALIKTHLLQSVTQKKNTGKNWKLKIVGQREILGCL